MTTTVTMSDEGKTIVDQNDEEWNINYETKWSSLGLDDLKQMELELDSFFSAFIISEKATSQILESERASMDENKYFGYVVGDYLSPFQLMTFCDDEGKTKTKLNHEKRMKLLNHVASHGLTTWKEYGDGDAPQNLQGRTRNTISDVKEFSNTKGNEKEFCKFVGEELAKGRILLGTFISTDYKGLAREDFYLNEIDQCLDGVTESHSIAIIGEGECERKKDELKRSYFRCVSNLGNEVCIGCTLFIHAVSFVPRRV